LRFAKWDQLFFARFWAGKQSSRDFVGRKAFILGFLEENVELESFFFSAGFGEICGEMAMDFAPTNSSRSSAQLTAWSDFGVIYGRQITKFDKDRRCNAHR
jgi:hypothetical protein